MKPDTPDRVESLARDLRRVPQTERTSGGYEQQLGVLFELVFEAGGLQHIGDLRLLDDIREILLDSHLETTYPDALNRLEQQLTSAAIAHDNLSAILDSSVPIRDLLYGIFDRWEGLAGPLDVHFSANDEAELDALRYGDQPPAERIQAFINRYMASVRAESPELADHIQRIVDPALSAVQKVSKGRAVAALFAQRGGRLGRALRVSVDVAPGPGEDFQANSVDQTMQMAARDAIAAVFTLAQMPRARSNAHWSIDEPTTYEGASIGLAIAIGTLAALRQSGVDPYAAFTGTVAFDGRVGAVQHISAKVAAAARAGLRRVFVPMDNVEEAKQIATGIPRLHVIGVNSIAEAWTAVVSRPAAASDTSASLSSQIRRVELECVRLGLNVYGKVERPGEVQLRITDHTSVGSLTVYHGKSGLRLVPGGPPKTALYAKLMTLVDSAKPVTAAVGERLHDRWQVPGPQERRRVEEALRAVDGAVERQEANCSYRLDFQAGAERVIARQFNTGTLTLQQVSPGAADSPLFRDLRGRVRAALGQPLDAEIPPRGSVAPHESASAAGAVEVDPARVFTGSWIGTDEAGKGDYFGPLVSAAMYVDEEIVRRLQELGVRDSKKLSDGRVRELAAAIRERCGTRVLRVVPLMPEAYNRLHEQFVEEGKSLNTLLAWAHARAIEDLLKRDVDTDNVLVDQFTDVKYITAALLQEGRTRHINLVAAPRAESNIAVAAASILARDRFLSWIDSESHRVGMVLPKGASDAVIAAARELVERLGEPALRRFVKLHFRTTQKVIGAPATPA